ncbi:MAG: PSD1 and planctomycete cytochrome C domain-containing protein [Pirellulales bacterium]
MDRYEFQRRPIGRFATHGPIVAAQLSVNAVVTIGLAIVLTAGSVIAAEPSASNPAGSAPDYLREVKPLLAKHCGECHGTRKQEGGLRLDTAMLLRAGGDSGPAIAPGKSANSLLIQAVRGLPDVSRMPPEGKTPLTAEQIDLLARWIDAGAAAPEGEKAETVSIQHWAFQRPLRPAIPAIQHASSARGPLDAFVLQRLEREGVEPSPEADRATLARRLAIDLLGLPPAADEVSELEADQGPDAIERRIDRWLAHPAFGERWGRYWLDQARYADSNGYTRDFGREIWPYRAWVIRAINQDLPFDQFTIEQLAGDLLPQATTEQVVATGFHRNTLINEEGGTDQEQFRVDAVADRVATTGQVWLGLTLGCARCHNHKYDPISQREFFQLFAILNNCDEPTIEAPLPLNVERGDLERRAEIRRQIAEFEKAVEARRQELEASQAAWEKTVTVQQRAQLPGPIQVAYDMPLEKRDAANKKTLEDYYKQTSHARTAFPELEEIAKLRAVEPKIPQTMVLKERAEPRVTHIHKRGDFLSLGVRVEPAVPAALHPISSQAASVSRLEFARWLVDPANPLTPRVIANRQWQYLFGRGLVETEDDFGLQGSPPTHPELLDWLACEVVAPGGRSLPDPSAEKTAEGRRSQGSVGEVSSAPWSLKQWARTVVSSATYRQSSQRRAELETRDPRNEWLARQNRLRVDAEIVRDLSLAASGLLTREIGGPSVMPPQPEGVYAFTQDPKPWKAETGANRYRRGLYTFFWRSLPYPMLTVFDAPNANVTCTRRIRSNTPLQALTLANDVAFVECARDLGWSLLVADCASEEERARLAFRTTLARSPSSIELARFLELIESQRMAFEKDSALASELAPGDLPTDVTRAEAAAWIAAARVLLNLDEFITRE